MRTRFLVMLTLVVMLALFAAAPCAVQAQDKVTVHEQPVGEGGGMGLASYGAFDNPNYYYAAVKVAPFETYYRQAGFSPDGTKIVAGKQWIDGSYTRREVVLMNADGSGETVISPGDSGEGDIYQYGNPFWSDDGTAIGYAEVHNANPNKIVRYDLAGSTRTYIYEPVGEDACNCDFLGNSKTSIVCWDWIVADEAADLFIWDGSARTWITRTPAYSEYEPVSNGDGTVIVYWSGETTAEPVNTTHTLTNVGGTWTMDVSFTAITDTYWSGWSGQADNYIATTVMSSKDILIYDSFGTIVTDLTGTGYSGGSGQWNFFGVLAEGPNGNWVITSNAARVDAGRDIVCAASRLHMYVAPPPLGSDANCGTEAAPFATIQKGVDEVISGGTVHVAAGLYVEDVSVSKSITLLGPKSGVARNTGSATDWTSSTTADWIAADAIAAGEAVIRSAAVVVDAVVDIADDCDVTVKGFVIEARNRTDGTNAHLIYTEGKNSAIQTVTVENNIIGPITGDAQDGYKGRFGLAFDSQSSGNNGLSGLVKGNKILGAEGNGANVFIIGQHYYPSMSDYSGMVIESNDVYGANRAGIELAGGIRGLTVRDNTVIYNGLIWNGTAYVQSARSAADPNNILFGAGINLIRTGTICGNTPDMQNAIEDLVLSGNTIAFNEKSGVYVDAQQRNVTLLANVITDNGRDGIWLDEYGTYNESKLYNEAYGYIQDVSVLNNTIAGADAPYAAVRVTGKPPALAINENNLSGSNIGVVQEDGVGQTWVYTADASANWWGDATPAGVAAEVGADVDYTPWLASGTDMGDPGFQGDFSTLWVDDNSPQTGTTGRIQEGINLVSGSTVYVAAGTYVEDPVIDKAVTLLGPNAGIDPNTGTRVAEAIIFPAYSYPNPAVCETIVWMGSTTAATDVSNITIDGFTFDGDNPALTSGIIIDGADVDACVLIGGWWGSYSNITIQNNILKYATYAGIDIANTDWTTTATAGNVITHNRFEDIGETTYNMGIGVITHYNVNADITHNVMTGVRLGIQTENITLASPGAPNTISNNTIGAWRLGIFHNTRSGTATTYTLADNTVTAESYPGITDKWNGILLSVHQGTADTIVRNNNITVPDALSYSLYSAGYNVWSTSSGLVAIEGGTITGGTYGIFVNNYEGYSDTSLNTFIDIDGVTILGSDGAGVYVKDNPLNTHGATVYADIQNCIIDTDATGILVDGTGASAKANYNKIVGNPTAGVTNNSGVMMDAELNWWGVPCGPSNTGADSVSANVDYTPWWSNAAMTVQGPIAGSTPTIPAGATTAQAQAVLDCAGPGSTVTFQSGSYPGGLFVNNSQLTLQLNGCTVLAPAFTIVGDNETILGPGTIDGGGGGGGGIVTGAAVNGLVIRDLEIHNGTGDGIHIGHNVTNLQILDNYIHNMGSDGVEYAAGVTVDGVHEVQGNLFQNNTGFGVNNASAASYNVEYNSWNDLAGPAGTNGDAANGLLDYTPWTHVMMLMASSGSPVPDKVAVGDEIVYTIKMDAAEVYGADFDLSFDNTRLSVVAIANSGAFNQNLLCSLSTPAEANTSGVISFCGSRTTALNGAAQDVYQVTFLGVAPGTVALDLDQTDDEFAMAPPYGASTNIYAAALNDGSVTVFAALNVTGRLDLQGRANDTGAVLSFGTGSGQGYGPFTFSASDYWGNISAGGVVEDTYPITVVMDRYLDVTLASGKTVAISSLKTTLSKLVLFGGDANDDDVIDVSDAAIIGGAFGTVPGDLLWDSRADINNDGAVNILDLVLFGGNYDKTSETAYAGWTP